MKDYEFEFPKRFVFKMLENDEEEKNALNALEDLDLICVEDMMMAGISAEGITKVINAWNSSNFVWLASERILFGDLDKQLEAIAHSLLSSYNKLEDMFDLLIEKLKNAETYFYFRVRDDWFHIIEETELRKIFDEIEKEVRQ